MKRKAAITALLTAISLAFTIPSQANRLRDNDGFDHPLHLVYLVVHPVAIALEYGVERPIHWAISQPNADIWFGHKSHAAEDATYFEWVHGDFAPSIAEEKEVKAATSPRNSSVEAPPVTTQGAATRKNEAMERRERNMSSDKAKAADEKEMNKKMSEEAREKSDARREMRQKAEDKSMAAEKQKAAASTSTSNSTSTSSSSTTHSKTTK
ncbi:hypothetical protein BH09SUM1_BH09SUM1_25280 [soil metagenome]